MAGNLILNNINHAYSMCEVLQKSSQFKQFSEILGFIKSWKSGQSSFELNTSGSTGKPKTVHLTRQQMISSALRTKEALGLEDGCKALMCINPNFIGGKMMLVRALEFDWDLKVIAPSSNPTLKLTEMDTFDFAAMVPLQVESMLKSDQGIRILNQIKTIIVGGAPVSLSLRNQLQSLKTKFYNTYGMTETVSHIALMALNGEPASDQFHLLKGIEAAVDERGCLKIKADVTNKEWIQTNDLVDLRSSKFKWLGRADFVVNSGGIKLHLDQLQQTIASLMNTEIALLKIKDQLLGESYMLVLKNYSAMSEKEVLNFLKSRLPKYHSPKQVIFVQNIPMTNSGKIDYEALKVNLGLSIL